MTATKYSQQQGRLLSDHIMAKTREVEVVPTTTTSGDIQISLGNRKIIKVEKISEVGITVPIPEMQVGLIIDEDLDNEHRMG